MNGIFRGWQLTRMSWAVLRADAQLARFTVLSAVCTLIAAAVFAVPGIAVAASGSARGPIGVVLFFLFYLVTTSITLYFNTALVAVALDRLRGGHAPMSLGYEVARRNAKTILAFALMSATLGVALHLLAERFKLAGEIVAGIIGGAWSIMTFLVVPVIVAEGLGPVGAIKRSGSLLRRTWGEQIGGNVGIGLVFLLLALPAAIPVLLALATGSEIVLAIGIAIAAIYLALLYVVATAIGQIFRAAVYLYAETGAVPQNFDDSLVRSAFRVR